MGDQRQRRQIVVIGLTALGIFIVSNPVLAAKRPLDSFRQGELYGQVVDATTQKPVAGATVALQNRQGHVLAWTVSNADGQYRLGAPCLDALGLNSHRPGMLDSLGRGFVEVVQLPVRAAGQAAGAAATTVVSVVKAANPVGTVRALAISAAEGNPLAAVSQASSDMQKLLTGQASQQVRANAAKAVVMPAAAPKRLKKKGKVGPQPGDAILLVNAPQYQPYQGADGAYWMQPRQKNGKTAVGPQAWLDTIRLAPVSDAKGTSGAVDQPVTLTQAALNPAFVAGGSPLQITVHLQGPPEPSGQVCVVARVDRTHQAVELQPQGGGLYSGTMTLDPNTPLGDDTVTVAALNAEPIGVRLRSGKGKQSPILSWAANLECLDAGKSYCFDPRFMASQNRIDLKMMVLNPALETPPPPVPPAATLTHSVPAVTASAASPKKIPAAVTTLVKSAPAAPPTAPATPPNPAAAKPKIP